MVERTDPAPFLIRRGRREDLRALAVIWRELMDLHAKIDDYYVVRPDGPDLFADYAARSMRSEDARVFVVDKTGAVVGFALAHVTQLPPVYRLPRIGVISDIAVASGHRRGGAGRALVTAALEWFTSRGLDRVAANMVPANPQALGFWDAMGFDVLSEYRVRRI
jgi:GNAT superfamily N-acetyltransferase